MIRYRLQCAKTHEFEAWFPSSAGFDEQAARGLVACPQCGSTKVSKALMAPSVVTSERKAATRKRRAPKAEPIEPAAPPATPGPGATPMIVTGPQREMLRKLKELRDKALADAEYVGPRFAEEARKIHTEETPSRGIYGEASLGEVEKLAEEGIEVFPIPVLPDDHN
jgi:hypothetical protein